MKAPRPTAGALNPTPVRVRGPKPRPEGRPASLWLPVALIVVGTLAAYSNSLHGPFVFDDLSDIVDKRSIRQLWPLRDVFLARGADGTVLQTRPLVNLTLAANYAMGGLKTLPYHATNLAIHLLAGLTLFGIVRRTLALPALAGRFGRSATSLALAVALLWTLHPTQAQAVTYVTQRYESMMGLFYLLAVYALIRSGASHLRTWTAAVVAATVAALGCKEVAVSVPLVLLLYDRAFLAGSFREALARRRRMYAGLAGAWALFGLLELFSESRGAWAGYGLGIAWTDYAKTQFGVILHYLRQSFWPHPLVLDYAWPLARSPGDILPGAAVVGGLLAATGHALVRRPAWGFLGAWFFLILAPTSSVLPLSDLAVTHRMYLPLAAVVVAAVLCWHLLGEALVRRGHLTARRMATVGACVASAVAALLAAATWERNRDFSSALSIWTDTVAKAPQNPRAHANLGIALVGLGRVDEAIAHYRQALEINPDYAGAHDNLGAAMVGLGRVDESIVHFRRALELRPADAGTHSNLGVALARLGRVDEAIAHFRQALAIRPDDAAAHGNLGAALAGLGRLDEAIVHYRQALDLEPGDARAHSNLGAALTGLGRPDEAIVHYRQALEIRPGYIDAHNNLGVALAALGRIDEAISHDRTALDLALRSGDQALAGELRARVAELEAARASRR